MARPSQLSGNRTVRASQIQSLLGPEFLPTVYPMKGLTPTSYLRWRSKPLRWWSVARLAGKGRDLRSTMLFQLGPKEMLWHLLKSEARSHIQVSTAYWTGQTRRWWHINDRGQSRKKESWGLFSFLLLPWGLFILRWQLWTRFHEKMPCRALAHPYLPLISHHLQRERLKFRAPGAPCSMQEKPGSWPHLICIACNAMTRLSSAEYAVSPIRTKSARKISRRGCSLTIWRKYSTPIDPDGMAMLNVMMVG